MWVPRFLLFLSKMTNLQRFEILCDELFWIQFIEAVLCVPEEAIGKTGNVLYNRPAIYSESFRFFLET